MYIAVGRGPAGKFYPLPAGQAEAEMASLRYAEAPAAIYRHDMRHHLNAINAFLADGKLQQAEENIKQVQAGIGTITPNAFEQMNWSIPYLSIRLSCGKMGL